MEHISFHEMKEEYLPEISSIYNHYIANSTATFHIGELGLDGIRDIVFTGNPRFKSFAIKDGNGICGYCLLAPYKKREAYDGTAEVTIYLKEGWTGKGIGGKALAHLERIAKENDFHVLLAVICGENTNSIRLFEKHGYEKCAHYREVGKKFGRLLDVVCYQKLI